MVLNVGEQLQQHFAQGGDVLMGNNAPCKYISVASVQIRMHDGVVRTLIKVHHVSKLKKNLVSVGAMDLEGFSCWVKGGVIQIKGKWKSLVMLGTKQENMYILLGSTVTGFVSTISKFGSHASNGSFDNYLWYLCVEITRNLEGVEYILFKMFTHSFLEIQLNLTPHCNQGFLKNLMINIFNQ